MTCLTEVRRCSACEEGVFEGPALWDAERHLPLEEIFDPAEGWRIQRTYEDDSVYAVTQKQTDGSTVQMYARPYDCNSSDFGGPEDLWVKVPLEKTLKEYGIDPPVGCAPGVTFSLFDALTIFRHHGDATSSEAHLRSFGRLA